MAARVAITAPSSDSLAVIPNVDGSVNVAWVINTPSGGGKVPVNVSSGGVTTIVPAVPGKTIRIVSLYLVVGGAVNINWQSHTTTSDADGIQDFAANGGIVLPFNPIGWFDTVQGEALDLVTSNGSQVGGNLTYATF
jgi:hypothetical protein